MDQNLGVRMVGRKNVPGGLELFSQLAVIVDLAIEDHPYGCILVAHGLVAGGKVDDCKPAEAQCDVCRKMESTVIRAAVLDTGRHIPDPGVRVRTGAKVQNASNATHLNLLDLGARRR